MGYKAKKYGAWTLIGLSLAIFGYTLVTSAFYSPEDSSFSPLDMMPLSASTSIATKSLGMKREDLLPKQIFIPAIGVDAKVQEVGLTYAGNIGIPTNFSDVAWYRYGPSPGERGNAIVTGHVDNGLALPGVFKRLDDLKSGDTIFINTSSGKNVKFVVERVDLYGLDEFPSGLFTQSGDSKLILITCKGSWLSDKKTYDNRLVVTAAYEKE